jgi:hypothetical protein
VFRAAAATALLGLALGLALPAVHLSAATTGQLIGRWWPLVIVVPGVGELLGGLARGRRRRLRTGGLVALVGLALLAGRFGMAAGPVILAVLLVLAAAALVGVPRWLRGGWPVQRFAGDVRLGGPGWRVEHTDFYQWVGQVRLDLSDARLAEGTTPLRFGMFAGEVDITVPADIGVRASARMFAGEIHLLGHEAQGVSPHLSVESDDYAAAPRRVDIDVEIWAGEVRVRRRG